jgi:hypothetical protein
MLTPSNKAIDSHGNAQASRAALPPAKIALSEAEQD